MSDTPHDQESDAGATDRAPMDGAPAEATSARSAEPVTGPPAGASASAPRPGGGTRPPWRPRGAFRAATEPDPGSPAGRRLGRRRRSFIIGIAIAAVVVAGALCAGALSIVSAWHGVRARAADARQDRQLRDAACLELEQRLNRLAPPGASTTPQARATAVQSENAAVRIYVAEIHSQRDQDAWRQLLDARTTYAEALTNQAKTRTPAFFVAPRSGDGQAVADQLQQWSPASCAGPIRRLAEPDL
jgi:hypothetical protein